MGPMALRLLCTYWERLQMVAWQEGTTENPCAVREAWSRRDPLLPTIFYVVVDTVVRHWKSMIAEGGGCDERDNSSGNELA